MRMKNDPGSAAFEFGRRDFLVLSAAAAAGLAATNVHSDVLGLTASPMPLLSIGYWNGSLAELTAEQDHPSHRRVVDASRLNAADASLARDGARVTIHGFWRAGSERTPLTLGMRAFYPVLDPATGRNASVIAWTWSYGSRVHNGAKLEVPIADTLDLAFERIQPAASVAPRRRLFSRSVNLSRTELASMTPRTGASGVKLRRGVYFVALRESDADRVPSWSSMAVLPGTAALDANGAGALRASTLGGLQPAGFSYLVLSVDSARA